MALVEFAREELQRAGLFDLDGPYNGMFGPAILKMVEQFAEEGHSGNSAAWTLRIFERLAAWKPINPIPNPMIGKEYIDHTDISGGHPCFQSTRLSTLFSEDGGKRWYDIDLHLPKRKRWLHFRRAYVTFPYLPK